MLLSKNWHLHESQQTSPEHHTDIAHLKNTALGSICLWLCQPRQEDRLGSIQQDPKVPLSSSPAFICINWDPALPCPIANQPPLFLFKLPYKLKSTDPPPASDRAPHNKNRFCPGAFWSKNLSHVAKSPGARLKTSFNIIWTYFLLFNHQVSADLDFVLQMAE